MPAEFLSTGDFSRPCRGFSARPSPELGAGGARGAGQGGRRGANDACLPLRRRAERAFLGKPTTFPRKLARISE